VNNSLERDEGFLESDHFWGRLKKRRKKEREIYTYVFCGGSGEGL
jgi:hypothetical protein